ncbi:c-type cytochrome [Methylomarinum sp. Ch1-1]|uniref:C-type cytochrome n=1 Tax=Methylomarinum roseum TaxID=3067653 RepID=A0AAU7NUX3_9GAMM|nr:c-type cytochrome [Methylomarinum sp. Ch1-1]MDP4519117.1 c-type cytochrome [Methylomarinum sp. Ch1-1]
MSTFRVQQIAVFSVLLGFFTPHVGAADIEAGKNKASMCAGCHGLDGASNNPMFPRLAGQSAMYLENQLKAFKSGARTSPMMQGMAAGLSDEDMKNLAAYFASLPAKSAGGDADLAKQGKEKVAMCLGCHGNDAQGRGQFPRLAGQHPQYLAKQLNAFKQGERTGGPMGAMSKNLSAQDIKEISAYLGSL